MATMPALPVQSKNSDALFQSLLQAPALKFEAPAKVKPEIRLIRLEEIN